MEVVSWAFLMLPDLGYRTFPNECFRMQSFLILSIKWKSMGTGRDSDSVPWRGTWSQYFGSYSHRVINQLSYDVSRFKFAKLQWLLLHNIQTMEHRWKPLSMITSKIWRKGQWKGAEKVGYCTIDISCCVACTEYYLWSLNPSSPMI